MKPKMFEELLETVRECGAILRGERKASRRCEVGSSGIRAIRKRTGLSQSELRGWLRLNECRRNINGFGMFRRIS